jgi:hypothetical protein
VDVPEAPEANIFRYDSYDITGMAGKTFTVMILS